MPAVIPPELKPITPYIRRAEELERDSNPDSKEIAYFCRSYAMEKAINLRGAVGSSAVDNFLMTLMGDLETAKKTFPEGLMDRGKIVCESFALSVFSKADEEDRSGHADKETARTFYTASSYFDILEQFGEMDDEFHAKNKYCKWKATEIMKALKEGRTPVPGGYDDEPADPPASPISTIPIPPSAPPSNIPSAPRGPVNTIPDPTFPPDAPSHMPSQRLSYDAIPQAPPGIDPHGLPRDAGSYLPQANVQQVYHPPFQHPQAQGTPPPPVQQFPKYVPPAGSPAAAVSYQKPPDTASMDSKTKDAMELCAFAMTALKHKEIGLAKDRLQEALRRLG